MVERLEYEVPKEPKVGDGEYSTGVMILGICSMLTALTCYTPFFFGVDLNMALACGCIGLFMGNLMSVVAICSIVMMVRRRDQYSDWALGIGIAGVLSNIWPWWFIIQIIAG